MKIQSKPDFPLILSIARNVGHSNLITAGNTAIQWCTSSTMPCLGILCEFV